MRYVYVLFFIFVILSPRVSLAQTATGKLGIGEDVVRNVLEKDASGSPVKGWSMASQMRTILSLKPKVFRMWFTADYLYDNDGNPSDQNVAVFNEALSQLVENNIDVIGMDQSFQWFITSTKADFVEGLTAAQQQSEHLRIPCPGTTQFNDFLDRYQRHWARMARLFPQVRYWQTANEVNSDIRLSPFQFARGKCGKTRFSTDEKVMIILALLERAKTAIQGTTKLASPKSLLLFPALSSHREYFENGQTIEKPDFTLSGIAQFYRLVYSTIASFPNGNARNYFDGVSWHPYIFSRPDKTNWVQANTAIHNVMRDFNDEHIPVVLSEVGNSELNVDTNNYPAMISVSESQLSEWLQETMRLTQEDMPWVTAVVWFRAFDDVSAYRMYSYQPLAEHEAKYGLHRVNQNGPTINPLFAAKTIAHTFCKYTACVPEPVRAITQTGWQAYYLNDTHYCWFSDVRFKAFTGKDLTATMTYLPAIDLTRKIPAGNCQ